MSGSVDNEEIESGRRRLPLVRGSLRLDQPTTMDPTEFGVTAVNVDTSLIHAGLGNQAGRYCLSSTSEPPPAHTTFSFERGWRGRKERKNHFRAVGGVDRSVFSTSGFGRGGELLEHNDERIMLQSKSRSTRIIVVARVCTKGMAVWETITFVLMRFGQATDV